MKVNNSSSPLLELKKQASKIKINHKLDSVADTLFFKKKMEKGRKMLAAPGLPK
jgi:hypothetical protein